MYCLVAFSNGSTKLSTRPGNLSSPKSTASLCYEMFGFSHYSDIFMTSTY